MQKQNKTLKSIVAELKALGYYMDDNENTNEFDLYFQNGNKKDDDDDCVLTVEFDDNESLPHCCGVIELGDLSLSRNIKNIPKTGDERKAIILAIQYAFLASKQHHNSSKAKLKVGQALIMASNGRDAWVFAEEALSGIPEHFRNVSTTRNGADGSIIKLYVGIY